MDKTDLGAPLWLETDFEDKPVGVRSRDELLAIHTDSIAWSDAQICVPFEVLLLPWGQARNLCSTAFARPLGADDLPFVALGSHRADGPRKWQGGGPEYNDQDAVRRHLRRALTALLRRRLWGRVLWLDRELNGADEISGVLRLYLGADERGEWFLPGWTNMVSVKAGFDWQHENRAALLLDSSDEALLEWVYAAAEIEGSDLAFSLNWTALGPTYAAREKRVALNFVTARGSIEEMIRALRLASQCEAEWASMRHICWEIDPLIAPVHAFGPREQWRERLFLNQVGSENFFDGNAPRRLPPFARKMRDWAHGWFGVEPNHELRARHRCARNLNGELTFVIERIDEPVPTAHEQLEAFAQLRGFLAERLAPDELNALLKSD